MLRYIRHLSCRTLTFTLQVFFVFIAAFSITGTYHGTGQHVQDIQPPTEIPVGLKVTFTNVSMSDLTTDPLLVVVGM